MMRFVFTVCAMIVSTTAFAECNTATAKDDLTDPDIQNLYDCIKDEMREGYAKDGNTWAKDYPNWNTASKLPAAPGPHGERFLMTFVNEVGYLEYVKFLEERDPMPIGTLIAKESFNLSKKGKVKIGPLFFMEKVAAGNADEFENWVYSAVKPNGKPMKIKQQFCHGCHTAFEDQDALGYPDEEYRVSGN